jgi:hypothetical protein
MRVDEAEVGIEAFGFEQLPSWQETGRIEIS